MSSKTPPSPDNWPYYDCQARSPKFRFCTGSWHKVHRLTDKTHREMMALAKDRRSRHQSIKRLCSLADQS